MPELRQLQRKLDSIGSLREIVGAMRNLAAIYVRRSEAALEAMRPYSEVVESALCVALHRSGAPSRREEPGGRCLALVFAGDQGLCGTYNDRVVNAAIEFKSTSDQPVDFVAVGLRGRDLLSARGEDAIISANAPTSLEGITAAVTDLAADVFRTYIETAATTMVFVYNAYTGMGRFEERTRRILPPSAQGDPGKGVKEFRYEPLLTAGAESILGALVEEYFFIELYGAMLESHSSENGARLVSMTAASGNIDERFAKLTQEFQSVRQDFITGELLDVVSGAEALHQGV